MTTITNAPKPILMQYFHVIKHLVNGIPATTIQCRPVNPCPVFYEQKLFRSVAVQNYAYRVITSLLNAELTTIEQYT